MERVITSVMELLSQPLTNLLLIRAKDLTNCPTIILPSCPPPSSSSSSWPSHGGADHCPPPPPPHTWYNKLVAYYRDHCDTVPYTNRTRFLLFSLSTERRFGNFVIEQSKSNSWFQNLPPTHPDSRRVQPIFDRIIHAAIHRAGIAKHIPFDWEIVVERDPKLHACCSPGGKIIINTRMLEELTTEAEIATIISREVARAIVRPNAEYHTKLLWFMLPHIILLPRFTYMCLLSGVNLWILFSKFPFYQRMRREAEYIGLLILASAGYDPHEASKLYEKLGQIEEKEEKRMSRFSTLIRDFFNILPQHKKRSQLVSQAMEEALAIYQEGIAKGNGVEKVN